MQGSAWIAVLLAGVLITAPGKAQGVAVVPVESPIRAYLKRLPTELETSALPRVTGVLAGVRRDTIFLVDRLTRDTAWLPVPNLDHIEYSTGQYHPVAKSALVGTALGLGIGAVGGFFRTSGACELDCYNGNLGGGQSRLRYAAVGAGVGLVGGLISGVLLTVERWTRADPAIEAGSRR